MLWAVREVDEGRPATPSNLLQPVRDGHAPALLATLLPQLLAALVMGALVANEWLGWRERAGHFQIRSTETVQGDKT